MTHNALHVHIHSSNLMQTTQEEPMAE